MALRSLLGAGNRLLAQDARHVVGAGRNGFRTSGKASMGIGSHASDNDPEILHKEKERNLKAFIERWQKAAKAARMFTAGKGLGLAVGQGGVRCAGQPEQSKIPGMEHGWNEKLASDSEAAVKSDRHVAHDTPIEELQQHSVKHIRKEHHEEDIVVETDKK